MVSGAEAEAYGGIAGYSKGTLEYNHAIGATIPYAAQNTRGIIVGKNEDGTLTENYYYGNCTFDGIANATGKGIGSTDGQSDVGGKAEPVYLLTLAEGITSNALTLGSYIGSPSGRTVTLGHTDRKGFVFSSYTSSDVTISNGTFTMPAKDVTVTATWTDMFGMEDGADGSADHPYVISTADGWNYFCDCLAEEDNTTWNRFSGMTVKLGANIGTAQNPITRWAGSSGHDFCGTFDGDKKTLTVKYGASDAPANVQNVAPFSYVSNTKPVGSNENSPATIKNLHVEGDIYTSKKYAAGIVGQHWEALNIKNCRSSIVIHSSTSGDGTHGGIEGESKGTLNVEGCVFDGKLITTNGTTNCAGFIAWGKVSGTISNCLYALATIEDGETEVLTGDVTKDPSGTFYRGSALSVSHCYYTRTLGTEQGKQARSITGRENVTVGFSGTAANTYDVSGITVYSLTPDPSPTGEGSLSPGLKYGDVLYAANEETVSLALSHGDRTGYTFGGYEASPATLSGTTLTMPDEDVTINATWTENVLELSDAASNVTAIADATGKSYNRVILRGRTLYKDDARNTLCLPFDLVLGGSPLDGADARKLTAASIEGTTLNLTFGDPVDELVAGTPYIIKWTDGTDDLAETDLVFSGVTIDSEMHPYDTNVVKHDEDSENDVTTDERVRYLGTYKSTTFENEDKSILFLGAENTLFYPQSSGDKKPTIGAQRAYFKIGEDDAPQQARMLTAFNINFGDGEASGITTTDGTDYTDKAGAWYDMSGRRLSGKPTKSGVYVSNGRKIVVK